MQQFHRVFDGHGCISASQQDIDTSSDFWVSNRRREQLVFVLDVNIPIVPFR